MEVLEFFGVVIMVIMALVLVIVVVGLFAITMQQLEENDLEILDFDSYTGIYSVRREIPSGIILRKIYFVKLDKEENFRDIKTGKMINKGMGRAIRFYNEGLAEKKRREEFLDSV